MRRHVSKLVRAKRQRVTRLELATSSLARRCSTTELHPHKSGSNNRSRPHQRKIFCRTVDETRQSRRLAQTPLQWSFRASVNESRWESFKVTQRDPSTDARDDDDFSRRVPTACQPRQSDSRGR